MSRRLFRRAASVITYQRELIANKDELLRAQQVAILEHQRALLHLAVAFRVAVESPEIDIRDDLDQMIRDLEDGVAQTEEHVVA